jgi:hypothetical protein
MRRSKSNRRVARKVVSAKHNGAANNAVSAPGIWADRKTPQASNALSPPVILAIMRATPVSQCAKAGFVETRAFPLFEASPSDALV